MVLEIDNAIEMPEIDIPLERFECETGGLNPLHSALRQPFHYFMYKTVQAMSPELGREEMSFASKMWDTASGVAKLIILIPLTLATGALAGASFAIKEISQLVLPSTITPFGSLDRNPSKWRDVDMSKTKLDGLDAFGAGTCDYQVRGPHVPQDNSQLYGPLKNDPKQDAHWAEFDEPKLQGAIKNYVAYSQWEDMDKLIKTMKHAGLNSLRLSPPESLYPNQRGEFNEIAIGRFKEILKSLNEAGISVSFTGFHFTYPQWIEDTGGYLNENNSKHFVTYMTKMFDEFHPFVRTWCTINEPAVFASQKYFRGVHAGGEINYQKMGKLMINFLKMHKEAYLAMKARPGGAEAIIGFSHDVIEFKPHNTWNPLDQLVCAFLTHVMHKAYLDFYKTGVFDLSIPIPAWLSSLCSFFGVKLPMGVHAHFEDPDLNANNKYMDRFFLQTYGRPELSVLGAMKTGKGFEDPDLYHPGWGCPADAYGVLAGIRAAYEATGKEIEITETGCPIPKVPEDGRTIAEHRQKQKEYTQRVLYVIEQAIEAGYPLRAVYVWSLLGSLRTLNRVDWFEWDELSRFCFSILDKAGTVDGRYGMTLAAEVIREVAMRSQIGAQAG